MAQHWTIDQVPDLTGKTAIITGANSGLGYETAKGLGRKGAYVVMACRDVAKGAEAAAMLQREYLAGSFVVEALDLADLGSVRQFATTFVQRFTALDILCNNAGVMHLPMRQTADGFEMQFGTNHLGHFALTGLLLPVILRTPQARVVTMSSVLHRSGKIDFADLQGRTSYNSQRAYGQSKLANLLFAYELQRKFEAHGIAAISVAAHPGYAATNLQLAGPQMAGSRLRTGMMTVANRVLAQSAARGALPIIYAATAPDVQGGEYFGPDGFMEMRGSPAKVHSSARSYDRVVAEQLWRVSEELTGVQYETILDRTPRGAPLA
ncbi:MAG: SDR family oxidoreductase [Herpetosiphonaceae bacterium]|nr:SDR family oxidoreductase [Herpetosiphonaceae bacterium]